MRPLVVQVVSSLSTGGAERVALELAARLPRGHWRSELLCVGPVEDGGNLYENPLEAEAARRGVQVRRIALPGIRDGAARAKLMQYLKDSEAALVHVHNRPADWQVLALARLARVSALYTRHLPYRDLSGRQRAIYALAARLAPAVVAVSGPVSDYLRREEHAPASKIRVIPNGIDLRRFAPLPADERVRVRAELGVAADAFVWICAARLAEQKGHEFLFEAFARLPENPTRVLLLAGDGPLESTLKEQAVKLVIANQVRFLGARTDVPVLLGIADAYACSSLSEGHPLSVLEALAMNLPVMAPRLAPIVAIEADAFIEYFGPARDAWTGTHDAPALAKAMTVVEARQGPGPNSREFIESRFSIESMIEAHAALYRDVLGLSLGS